jgi:hypothetical protein
LKKRKKNHNRKNLRKGKKIGIGEARGKKEGLE